MIFREHKERRGMSMDCKTLSKGLAPAEDYARIEKSAAYVFSAKATMV